MNTSAQRSTPTATALTAWRPVLAGAERERALRAAVVLADRLRWLPSDALGCALADGAAGLAVTFSVLARVLDVDRYGGPAERYLALAVDGACAEPHTVGIGFHHGLTGVGWAELRCGQPVAEDLDELLASLLGAGPWPGALDVASGLVGVGIYALERARGNPRLLEVVIDRLAEARPHGLHERAGLPAFVALAALAARCGLESARGLLAAATGALLADVTDPPGVDVAAALALAAPLTLHPLVGQTLRRALGSVSAASLTADALYLDHGIARVAHSLAVLAAMTGSTPALQAARRWALALLEAVEAGRAPARPGLLDGAAGVVLALLAAATDDLPLWNRLLLLT